MFAAGARVLRAEGCWLSASPAKQTIITEAKGYQNSVYAKSCNVVMSSIWKMRKVTPLDVITGISRPRSHHVFLDHLGLKQYLQS